MIGYYHDKLKAQYRLLSDAIWSAWNLKQFHELSHHKHETVRLMKPSFHPLTFLQILLWTNTNTFD